MDIRATAESSFKLVKGVGSMGWDLLSAGVETALGVVNLGGKASRSVKALATGFRRLTERGRAAGAHDEYARAEQGLLVPVLFVGGADARATGIALEISRAERRAIAN